VFEDAANVKVNGLVFNLEESNLNISQCLFRNMLAHSGTAIRI